MAGCLDTVRMPNMEWLEVGDRRNLVASVTSGILVRYGPKWANVNFAYATNFDIVVFLRMVVGNRRSGLLH